MSTDGERWLDAGLAAALFAVDPHGTGGVALRAGAGPVRDRWLAQLRTLLPPDDPVRRLPLHAGEDRLLGGLELAATLRAGRPVAQRGLLAEADGGVAIAAMAERMEPVAAGLLAAALDAGSVRVERDGFARRETARFGLVALDEGAAEDERPSPALLDRLAFRVDLEGIAHRSAGEFAHAAGEVASARQRLARVTAGEGIVRVLCGAALGLGVASLRAPLLAMRAARAAAALDGRQEVSEDDAVLAARLVLAPRATRLPAPHEAEREEPAAADNAPADAEPPQSADAPLEDRVLEAARAAIPQGLLEELLLHGRPRARPAATGRAGGQRHWARRGRPAGTRPGKLRDGARLSLVETLRAAAPWQRLRRPAEARRIEVRSADFRLHRYKQRAASTTIFAVDASGSAALHRLAEAKGAVELLLAQSYVRRDRVALIAFRGKVAEILLPPTRALARAKRGLASLPGGGGTPLAAGIDAAVRLATAVRYGGERPLIVFLTDGRANVALDGQGSRARAAADALEAGRRLRATGIDVLLVDTAQRPEPLARELAGAMGARYLPLPQAGAAAVARAVSASVAA